VGLDAEGNVVAEVTRERAVDTTPGWSPGGSTLLWASDRTGIPNLFAAVFSEEATPAIRQVTNVLGGASHPSVDRAARWVYFSSYHADGWHVERIPFSPSDWFAPQPASSRFDASRQASTDMASAAEAAAGRAAERAVPDSIAPRNYQALSTLRPHYWFPLYRPAEQGTDQSGQTRAIIARFVGIALGGTDLVGRHSYNLSGRVAVDGNRFTGSFGYGYRGLGNPVIELSLSQGYDASSRTLDVSYPDGSTREFFLLERERAAQLSASFLRRRYRTLSAFTVSGGLVQEYLTIQDPAGNAGPELRDPRRMFSQLRATLSASNTQRRALSISREDGLRGWASALVRRQNDLDLDSRGLLGVDRSYVEATGEVSAFKSLGRLGFANHVLALRFSAGIAAGSGANQFHFDLGDAEGSPEPATGLGLFGGSSRLLPLRGYRRNYRSGRTAWTSSAEYRFPIALLDAGLPFAPLFFDRVHGSLFFDAGNAWGPTLGEPGYDNPRMEALTSVGAELSVIVAPVYQRGFGIRFGAGSPLTGAEGTVFYLRVGNAF